MSNVQGLVATFAGGALVAGLNNLASELDVFDDLSARTGVAVQDLQALGLAFETNGSSAEEMAGALTRLQSSLGGLSDGGKEQAEVFKKLGIATKDAAGKAPTLATALPQIFENFGKIGSEAEQARVATTLFGRTGVKLLPVLRDGEGGLEKLRGALDAVGGGATEEATQAAGAYRDALARLHYSFFSLKGLIATAVFPRMQQVVESSARAIGKFSEWAKQTTLVDTAALALSGTLALKLGSALAPYLKSGLKFGAIFLAIDDLVAFLQGKDSLIGRLLDKAFGEGAATAVRLWVNDSIYEIKRFLSSGQAALDTWRDSNASTWTKLLAVFATGWRDLLRGFPVFRAEAAETWEGVNADFQRMILTMLDAWNGFIDDSLGALPDALRDALKIDTSGVQKRVQARENDQQAARERSDAEALAQDGPRVRPSTRVRLAAGADGSPRFEDPGVTGANDVLAAAHGRPEVAIQSGPYAPGLAPSFNMTQQNTISVTVPAGTPAAQAREIARQAAEGVRDANRSAKQALTQRGTK